MPKFSMLQGNSHLGDLEAFSEEEALKQAKKLYPETINLRVEVNNEDKENSDRANPLSASEMRKAVQAMVGASRPLVGKKE